MSTLVGTLLAAAAGVSAWFARRAQTQRPRAMRVVDRVVLGRDAGLVLLEIDGKRILVGHGAHAPRLLDVGDGHAPFARALALAEVG